MTANNTTHKLSEEEIMERLKRGVGVKRGKQLLAKLLRLRGIRPYHHLKAGYRCEDNSGMSYECCTASYFGFTCEEHSWVDKEGYINHKDLYRSEVGDISPEAAEDLFPIAKMVYIR